MNNKFFIQIKTLKEKGFFHLIVSNYSIQVIVFVSHLLIAKFMNPTYVGIIKLIETYVSIAVVLGGGGMMFSILKEVPQQNTKEAQNQIFRFGLLYVSIFSFGTFLFFEILAFFKLISSDIEVIYWFKRYALIIVPMVIFQYLTRYYQVINQFKKISLIVLISKAFSFVIIIGLTYFMYIGGYVLSMIITLLITVLILLYDLRSLLWMKINSISQILKSTLLRLARQGFFAQVVDQIRLWGNYLVANYLLLDRNLFGQFSFAMIIVQGLNIISTSLQQFTTPKLSSLAKDKEVYYKKLKSIEKNYILVTGIVFIIAQLVLPTLIVFVFGHKYDDAFLILRILLVGWFIGTFFALKGIPFISFGKMKYISISSFIIVIIILPVSYFLIKHYSVYGASVTFVLQNIIMGGLLIFFNKRFINKNV